VDAAIIVTMVLIGVGMNFSQSHRSQAAAAKLREQATPSASALRDGEWCDIPRSSVVPGDIVRLSAGDLVPADGSVLTARDLHTQEAALTGESLPVAKVPGGGNGAECRVLMGTSVVSGTGTVEITATGANTEFGAIAARLSERHPETEFERGLKRFGYLILRTTFFLVLLILVVRTARHMDPLQSLLFAVALAVGLTPEFLPMITSLTLAKGALRMAESKVIVRHLGSIQNLGAIDILCSDKTGTLTAGDITLEDSVTATGAPSDRPFELAYWNSKLQTGVRSALDTAILKRPAPSALWTKRDELPFDFQRRRLSIVADTPEGRLLVTKGAPESVFVCCADFAEGAAAQGLYESLSRQGKRLLAVAYKSLGNDRDEYGIDDEKDLMFAGFLVFSDPVLPEAADMLVELANAGVSVKILTGDSHLVAENLCAKLELPVEGLVHGDDLAQMSEAALDHIAEAKTVFARVTPSQKTRIVQALKRRGHVVGFMGDGINDAPSLRSADVGISVASAVDVAREAADIVLTQPGLRILLTGILEGRRAYGNILKYLFMGTSSNFGNMLSMAVASTALPFLPMLPTQILLNNFLYDMAQVTIPLDRVDPQILRAPRRWDIGLVRAFMLFVGPVSSLFDFLTFYVLLHVFHASEELFHTGWFVESLATQTLVLLVIRTFGNPFASKPSPALLASTVSIAAIAFAFPYLPLARAFGFVPLPAPYVGFVLTCVAVYLILVHFIKKAVLHRYYGSERPQHAAHP
jgi:Mg2+-importing ATPase